MQGTTQHAVVATADGINKRKGGGFMTFVVYNMGGGNRGLTKANKMNPISPNQREGRGDGWAKTPDLVPRKHTCILELILTSKGGTGGSGNTVHSEEEEGGGGRRAGTIGINKAIAGWRRRGGGGGETIRGQS